jgi:hypothetical protein
MNLEEALREVLAEGRPARGAPPALRERVHAVSQNPPPPSGVAGLSFSSLRLTAALLAVAFVLVVLAVAGLGSAIPSIGAPPIQPPVSATFDPTVEGVGIASRPADTVSTVPWLLAGVAIIGLVVLAVLGRRLIRAAAPVLAILVVAGAHSFTTTPTLEFGFGWGAVFGLQGVDRPSSGAEALHVSAGPGDPIHVAFTLQNVGALPIRLLGVIEELPEWATAPRWTAVGMLRTQGALLGYDNAQPLEPIDLAPGDYLNLYLVGRAGPCALGREVAPGEPLTMVGRGDSIALAYTVLGMTGVADVALPFAISEPQREDCVGPPIGD